jgi:hypothetical protein
MAQEPQFQSLPVSLAYPFLDANGLATEAAQIRANPVQLASYHPRNLQRASIVALLRQRGLLDQFVESNWPFALTAEGKKKLDYYDRLYSMYLKSIGDDNDENEDEAEAEQFPLEAHLRDYLAKNPTILEPGLSLGPVENGNAVEFLVDEQGKSRRIDILAKDHDGLPVIIELKVSKGHEKTVGQALYYRAKIKTRFHVDRARIFIVAGKISPELRAAASEVSDVLLFEYSLAVKVTPITQ